jgi:Holliday junction resolvasome RuvABC DNA-binding subunit
LKRVKGIGKKTDKRVSLEMAESLPQLESSPEPDPREREAVDALTGLGFTRDEASSAVSTTQQENPNLPLKELIQKSLKRMEPTG